MRRNEIFIMGSYVTDLTARTKRLPKPGETVLGQNFRTGAGGKGSNQAAAVARLDGEVILVTKLGDDEFGQSALKHLTQENIDVSHIVMDKENPTGSALIAVDDESENMIVVTLGACNHIKESEIRAAEEKLKESTIVLMQLETNLEAIEVTLELAKNHKKPVILNPAPYRKIPQGWLAEIDYITPNETELAELTQMPVNTLAEIEIAAEALHQMGSKNIIVTLGQRGSFLYNKNYKGKIFDSFSVEAIDTTGAGDAFNGGFSYALANGYSIIDAIEFANAIGALSVTKEGTAKSMPTLKEVDDFLNKI